MTESVRTRSGAAPSQLALDLPHRPSLARDDLIVTDANRLAVAAIDAWPAWAHPVLLIVGPAGAGKSHLAAAWAEISGAARLEDHQPGSGTEPFAVVIDDVDREPRDETAIFAVVNAARLGGGSVLLTARRHPAAMDLRLADLRSRLQAATIAELGAPDDALLEGVLAKLFADRQMTVEPKLLRYAALRIERSLETASRLVEALDHVSLAEKARITRPLLARVLGEADLGESEEHLAKPADYDTKIGHRESEGAAGAGGTGGATGAEEPEA